MTQHGSIGMLLPEEIDAQQFRRAMGAFPTGVSVVTTAVDDELYGMTVNSLTSLSLDPMLVLICVRNSGRGRQLLEESAVFSINVLAADQEQLSRTFADSNRPTGPNAFEGIPFGWGATGCPVLLGAAAHLDCLITQVHSGGDHLIVIGEVLGLGARRDREPLVFCNGSYRTLTEAAEPVRQAGGRRGARGSRLRLLPGLAD
jgi:flavin reductase (DIM6/NTAB) family NADH-FMN oxidoreductase RutF